jgi:hypothetical protein
LFSSAPASPEGALPDSAGAELSDGDLPPFFSPQAVKVSISANDKNIINVFFIRLPPKIFFIASQLLVS